MSNPYAYLTLKTADGKTTKINLGVVRGELVEEMLDFENRVAEYNYTENIKDMFLDYETITRRLWNIKEIFAKKIERLYDDHKKYYFMTPTNKELVDDVFLDMFGNDTIDYIISLSDYSGWIRCVYEIILNLPANAKYLIVLVN